MSEEGIRHADKGEPDSPNFRITRAALETGKVAALNEGVQDEVDIIVICQNKSRDEGASLSVLPEAQHLEGLIRATQSFADMTNQPIQVMRIEGGGQG